MIDSLSIDGFKRFTEATLAFRPLTVLTGLNGTGKSTAIQALLLCRQLAEKPGASVVQLNGPHGLALGEAMDVLHPDATTITIAVDGNGQHARYVFALPDDRALHLTVRDRPDHAPSFLTGQGMAFSYLNAERLGPRDQLDVTADDPERVGIGVHGEYTAQVLALRETEAIRPEVRHPSTEQHGVTTLRTQVESWASEIIRPIRITAQWPPGITASLIRFQEPGLLTEKIRPANVGFGFSYALPVIVAALLLPPEGILIVENPEAHLHPAGQSRLGQFLAQVAGSGSQVVLETHSDHIINGIRLAVARDRSIDTADTVIHFFDEEADGGPTRIDVTPRGGLSTWPSGFFDQIERDLGEISRAKRRGG